MQPSLFYRWENPLTNRYYMVYLHEDLLHDWILTRIWGRKGQATGRIIHTPYASYAEATTCVRLIQQKRKQRGYHLSADSCSV